MTWLSEDPWPIAGLLGVLAVALLLGLKITQQGKLLIGALGCLALALVVIVVEQFWVTDAERIEAVVAELGRAVERSDVNAVMAMLTPDVTYTQHGVTLGGAQARLLQRVLPEVDPNSANLARVAIATALRDIRFDFVKITRIQASAGRTTRMGKADIRVFAAGTIQLGGFEAGFATDASGTDWSLGFREVKGRWMIDSITAMRIPRNWRLQAVASP